MMYRENTRMERTDIPVYHLMRAAERRRQTERDRVPWPWPLMWAWCAMAAGWAWLGK